MQEQTAKNLKTAYLCCHGKTPKAFLTLMLLHHFKLQRWMHIYKNSVKLLELYMSFIIIIGDDSKGQSNDSTNPSIFLLYSKSHLCDNSLNLLK